MNPNLHVARPIVVNGGSPMKRTIALLAATTLSARAETSIYTNVLKQPRAYLAITTHTGSAIEYFTWLSAKLDSIEAMPSSRVNLFFKNASYDDRSAATTRSR